MRGRYHISPVTVRRPDRSDFVPLSGHDTMGRPRKSTKVVPIRSHHGPGTTGTISKPILTVSFTVENSLLRMDWYTPSSGVTTTTVDGTRDTFHGTVTVVR